MQLHIIVLPSFCPCCCHHSFFLFPNTAWQQIPIQHGENIRLYGLCVCVSYEIVLHQNFHYVKHAAFSDVGARPTTPTTSRVLFVVKTMQQKEEVGGKGRGGGGLCSSSSLCNVLCHAPKNAAVLWTDGVCFTVKGEPSKNDVTFSGGICPKSAQIYQV